MTARSFLAAVVSVSEESYLNTFVVVLAEGASGDGQRVELQRSLTVDQQDRRLGQDTYSISDERGVTHYGGIERWEVGHDRLDLHLDPSAASAFGVDRIAIDFARTHTAELESGLRRVLGDST